MCVLDSLMAQEDLSVTDLRDPRLWSEFGFVTTDTNSGITVNPDNALALGAYYDGIRIISEDIGKLPFITYRRLTPRGKERARDHPIFPLLNEAPNQNMSAMAFRETLTANAIGWGGGFALIRKNGLGEPIELKPIHPSRVQVELSQQGRMFYIVGNDDGSSSVVRQSNMFHLHGLSPDGMNGYSVARLGAESIGRGLSAAAFSASFFRQGSSPKGAIKTMRTFETDEAIERLRSQWQRTYSGSDGWHRPIILEAGMEWQPISVPPEDAQLIETEHFSVIEIARWLRIAPHKLGALERSTFSNIEEQNIDHVNDTLIPWARRWEAEAHRKLFVDDPDHFAEHLFLALLRGNSEQRSGFHRELFNIGAVSQNDVRELENMNPIGPEGDVYYVNGNLVRSQDAAEGSTAATTDPPAGRVDGFDSRREEREGAFFLFTSTLERCQAKERRALSRIGGRFKGEELVYQVKNFYSSHRRHLVDAFEVVAMAVARMAGTELESELTEAVVGRYVSAVTLSGDAGAAIREMDPAGSALVEAFMEKLFARGDV